jgi:hypothetical protein
VVAGGRDKDDIKQNTLAALITGKNLSVTHMLFFEQYISCCMVNNRLQMTVVEDFAQKMKNAPKRAFSFLLGEPSSDSSPSALWKKGDRKWINCKKNYQY